MSFLTRLSSAQRKRQASADHERQSNHSSALQRRGRDLLNLQISLVVRDREEAAPFNPNRSRDSSGNEKSSDYVAIDGGKREKQSRESSMQRLNKKLTNMRRTCEKFRDGSRLSQQIDNESIENESHLNDSLAKSRSSKSPSRSPSCERLKLLN